MSTIPIVGTAYVRTEVLSRDLGNQISSAVKKNLDRTVLRNIGKEVGDTIGNGVENSGLKEKIKKQVDDATKDAKAKVKIDTEADTRVAKSEIAYAARDRHVNLWVSAKTKAAVAEITSVVKALSGYSLLVKWRQSFTNLLTSIPAVTTGLAKFGSVVGAIVPPLMSMMSTLAPIGAGLVAISKGAIVAIPALLGAASVVGVLVAAFKGLDKAGGAAGEFYDNMQRMGSNLSFIKKEVQQAFFRTGEFNNAMNELNNLIISGPFRKGLKGVAKELSSVMASALTSFTDAFSPKAAAGFFKNLRGGLESAREGLSGFASGFAVVATKGSEVFGGIGNKITELGVRFNEWANTADISGMISNAATQFGHLWDVAKNLGGVIAGVFRAMDTGKSTGLESLAETLGKVRAVVEGETFQTAMRTVFTGAAVGAAALRDTIEPLGRAFESMAPSLGQIFALLGQLGATALTGVAEALNVAVNSGGLQSALEAVASLVSNIPWDAVGVSIGIIGDMVAALAPTVSGILSAIVPYLPGILSVIQQLITPLGEIVMAFMPLLSAVLGEIQPLLQMIVPILEDFAGALSGLGSGDFTGVFQGLADALSGLGDMLLGILPELLPMVWELVAGLAASLAESAPQLAQAFMGIFTGLVDVLIDLLPTFIAAAKEMWGSLVTIIPQVLPEIVGALVTILPSILSALLGMIPQLVSAGLSVFRGLVDALVLTIPIVIQMIVSMLPQIVQTLTTMLPSLVTGAMALFQGLIDGVLLVLPMLVQTLVGTLLPGVLDALISMIPVILPAALDLFLSLVTAVVEALPQILDVIFNVLIPGIFTALVAAAPKLLEAGMQLMGKIGEAVNNILPKLLAALASLVGSMASNIGAGVGQLLEAGAKLLGGLLNGVKNKAVEVMAWASGLVGRFLSAVGDVGHALYSAGRNLIDGFINGVKAMASNIANAARNVVQGAIDAAKNLLGIRSPSKVFTVIGEQTGAGLANGLKSSTKKVAKTTSRSFKAIGGTLGDALARGVAESASKSSTAVGKAITMINQELARIDDGASKSQKKRLKDMANSAKKLLEAQQKTMRSLWADGDDMGLDRILRSLTASGNWTKTASKTIRQITLADISQAKDVMVDRIKEQEKVLEDILKKFDSMRDNVASGVTGVFNLKGARSVSQVTTQLSSLVGQAKTFATRIKALIAAGFPPALVQQIAGLGLKEGSTVAETLLKASPNEIETIKADYSALTSWANEAGTAVAQQMYGAGIAVQQGLIDGLEADMSKLEAAGERIAEALTKAVKKKLKIKSPSRVFMDIGEFTSAGLAKGIESGKSLVTSAMDMLESLINGDLRGEIDLGARTMSTASVASNGTSGGNTLYWNGNLVASDNPRVQALLDLLVEVLGEVGRLENAGQPAVRVG